MYKDPIKRSIHTRWYQMKLRCCNPHHKSYKNYGARGITMCSEWLNSFKTFYDWAIEGYAKNLTIDRIDNNGNYEPSNCHWATKQEQVQNRRCGRDFGIDLSGDNRESNKALYNVMYYQNNRDKILTQTKEYQQQNKEKIAARKRLYKQKNKEKIANQNKAYRQANKEKISAYMKSYYRAKKSKEAI